MATAAQQAAFQSTYGPQAIAAGNVLGIDPNLIYAQWANESGYGTNSQSQNYNVAGIMPGGQAASYASPSAFEQSYVQTVQNDFPLAVGSGSNANQFVSGLQHGTLGSYFGTDSASTYLSNIQSIAGNTPLSAAGSSSITGGSAVAGSDTPATTSSTATTPAGTTTSNSATILGTVWNIVKDGLIIGGGFALVLVALIALFLQSKTVATPLHGLV